MGFLKSVIYRFIRLAIALVNCAFETACSFIYARYHRPLPPITNPILLETAESLALKIRTKKLRSEEVIESFISRIREVNPIINAVVDERFGTALEDARAADRLVASGRKTQEELAAEMPLLGVPFTIKDSFKVKGLRQTSGCVGRKNEIPSDDADVVRTLRKAGAIPIAVTNVPELCSWSETSNNVYGRTNNPYDNARTAGGSSGGEGALISSAGSVFGIGSDIGGSIRMPAFMNGIFGLKPSRGIVSNDGQFPSNSGKLNDYNTTGPICRYASDLSLVYRVIAGSNAKLLQLERPVDLKKVKFFYMEDDGGSLLCSSVHPEIREALRKVLAHLDTAYGIKAQKINLRNLRNTSTIFFTKIEAEAETSFLLDLGLGKREIIPYVELFKWFFGKSDHTLAAIALSFTGGGIKNGDQNDRKADAMIQDLLSQLQDFIGENGVFLYPTYPTLPFYHNQCIVSPVNFSYCSIFNILGLPSTACPLGLTKKERIPIGIQVVSWHANDHLSLAVARELEKAFGGWVSPSQIL